jgi:general secretion pathway protein G
VHTLTNWKNNINYPIVLERITKTNQRGFSTFELVVVITVIGVLLAIAVSRIWPWQVAAERAAMENVLGGLRSALGIKVAHYIARDQMGSIIGLVSANPMNELAEIPKNYVGEADGFSPPAVEGGSWLFDRSQRVLVYRVRNLGFFEGGAGVPAYVRFAVEPVYTDSNRNGRFDKGDQIQGVRISALDPYRWTD